MDSIDYELIKACDIAIFDISMIDVMNWNVHLLDPDLKKTILQALNWIKNGAHTIFLNHS